MKSEMQVDCVEQHNSPVSPAAATSLGTTETMDPTYFRLRDFEYVQPLYDLAFLLEVDALAKGAEVPKYRTFSLWRAAYSLDGYGTRIDEWLNKEIADEDLDYIPSNRIRQYLTFVRRTGTIPELKPYRSERFDRCLRLRSVRGLGPNRIALTISSEPPDQEWFSQTAINVSLERDRLADLYQRNNLGPWQSAHIVPPLLRFLNTLQAVMGVELKCDIHGIESPIHPVSSKLCVSISTNDHALRDNLKRVLRREKLFKTTAISLERSAQIRHQMGWQFSINGSSPLGHQWSIPDLAKRLDPFASSTSSRVLSDLHLHTAWSDGSASVGTMARAIAARGLTHFAVTDHSRSSKVQGGLTPPLWLRQANALTLAAPVCRILHGIEVDILKDGRLDLPHSLLQAADLVVASVHSNWTDNRAVNTGRLIKAIHSGCIDILAHPTSALVGKPGIPDYLRAPADLDWDEVLQQCAVWRVAVEFNCFPSRLDLPLSLLKKAAAIGCAISLGSDAHARSHLQNIKFGEALLCELPGQTVLNCLNFEQLSEWLAQSRKIRSTLNGSAPDLAQGNLFADATATRRVRCRVPPPQQLPSGSAVVGIDLTAGDKPTGIALLTDSYVRTCSLLSDKEILDYIQDQHPQIISIDSPLGLPGGGQSIDPSAGIVRVAEHDLASIGIPAYPALIDSMRELTLRGMRLRRSIEGLGTGLTIIESYPGAAQDILCIPRKQKSLQLLREGLQRLGLTGPGLETRSHDEMDAITSAIVGRYFEAGQFEPMGIPSEAQLIVPKVPPLCFESSPVICLSGKTGAGKSVVARYLSVFYGFKWIKTRDVIRDLLDEDRKKPVSQRLWRLPSPHDTATEDDLREFGAIVLNEHKQIPLQRKLTRMVQLQTGPVVVDSIRDHIDLQVDALDGRPVLNWFVDATDSIIEHRRKSKSKLGQNRPAGPSPVDRTVAVLRRMAHRHINNNGSLEELRWAIDDTLFADLVILHQ